TEGYRLALEQFDVFLADIRSSLQPDDILAITGDHGNDPALPTSDHTREYVPLLVYGNTVGAQNLGVRATFADLGQTAAEYLGIERLNHGCSFLRQILKSKEGDDDE
ncbi:MAG: phosphopentomutase, partial [Clostridia bacterium]|nr:phosphopentomutase [Clostridia bacterium]